MSDQSNAPVASEAPIESADTSNEAALEAEASEEVSQEAEGQELEASAEETKETKAEQKKQEAAVKKAIKKLKLKVDGKEFDEELPFELPEDPKAIEYMQRQLQLAKMGQSRSKYASDLEKQVAEFFSDLKKNPRAILSNPDVGVDLKKLAREIIEEDIANSQKSPEQLEKEKLESELKALKEQQAKEKKEFEEREFQRLQEQAYEQYDMQINKALETSGLPKSPYVIKKMAEYMLIGLQKGKDVSADDVVPLVREEIQNDIKELFSAAPDELVEQMLGKEKLTSLRKKSIAKAKGTPPTPVSKAAKDVGKSSKDEAPKEDKKMSYREFFKI